MSKELAVLISFVYLNGATGTYRILVSSLEQAQRILDQLNSKDDFVQIGEPAQPESMRMNKSLIVSATIQKRMYS